MLHWIYVSRTILSLHPYITNHRIPWWNESHHCRHMIGMIGWFVTHGFNVSSWNESYESYHHEMNEAELDTWIHVYIYMCITSYIYIYMCITSYIYMYMCITLSPYTHSLCCSVLQCVAVCCSVLQCVAVFCSVLQCAAVCCSVLQYHMISIYSFSHSTKYTQIYPFSLYYSFSQTSLIIISIYSFSQHTKYTQIIHWFWLPIFRTNLVRGP